MLKDKNDSDADARELVRLLKALSCRQTVNDPVQPVARRTYECSTETDPVVQHILRAGISAPVRYPRGRTSTRLRTAERPAAEKRSRADLDAKRRRLERRCLRRQPAAQRECRESLTDG